MKITPISVNTIRTVPSPAKASRAKPCGVFAGLELFGKHRHEGHVERAFGKEPAEHVGQGEGDQERLGHRPGAKVGRDHDVAHKAQHAAEPSSRRRR